VNDLPPSLIVGLLVFLIICSAFFSSSETGILSLNRYRLRHLSKQGHRGAKRVSALLSRPDRLLGTILIGNTFANILASSLATILALQLWGDTGVAIATVLLTFALLIFGEIAPKTLAAVRPEAIAYPFSLPLSTLLASAATASAPRSYAAWCASLSIACQTGRTCCWASST
jgi:Mg2+/Co2+ transporter CorB